MKRIKKLEYPWIFKDSFYVCAYTIKHSNGKNMLFMLTTLAICVIL